MTRCPLPIAIIGAGPVGLAAAAQLHARGLEPLVLEAGAEIGHAVRAWRHVRMFSPWGFNTDAAARALLEAEVRLGLDPAVEATPALAPLIDPNLHSCGTVRPHGEAELRHPEAGFYIAGMKSYGRAPTFLLATGHEQVRSIAAFLAGDIVAARRVELVLPETGVCATDSAPAAAPGCCTPTPAQTICCAPKPELAVEAPCCGPAANQPPVATEPAA